VEPSARVDDAGVEHPPAAADCRIVSLVPSLTELLFTLGMGERVVGRTGFCVHPRPQVKRVPKVGGTKDVDLDRVRELAPTHLVVNIDENRKEAIDALRPHVPEVIVTHPLRAADNVKLYALFGAIFGREAEAAELVASFGREYDGLRDARSAVPRLPVLYIIWRNPWMTVSRETYIASMLALAGFDTLPERAAKRYPEVTQDDWRKAAHVFLSSEPYAFRRKDAVALEESTGLPVSLIDGEMVSWYGSRAIEGLRYLRDLRLETG
jgi:ABC-type Fe3+-hydroxamate transport system substrate-binding protein